VSARGFTLLETMVALVILSLVVVATLSLHATSLRSISRGEEWTTAVGFAESAMEEVKLRSAGELSRAVPTVSLPGGYTRSVSVVGWSADLQLVVVTVELPTGGSFRLSRLFALTPR
jgi:type II secretion system protein I